MGTRSATQTALAILTALLEQRTLIQSELSHVLGIGTETLRRHLLEMQRLGLPLEREQEGTTVFWSIPAQWGPGGVHIPRDEAARIVRYVARMSPSRRRDALLDRLIGALSTDPALRRAAEVIIPPIREELEHLELVEDGAIARSVLEMHYYSMGRGELAWRRVSVQRVLGQRFVASCHRDGTLKWFRVDNIAGGRLVEDDAWREAPMAEVEAFIAASVNGFNANEPVARNVFVVSAPADRWVQKNLPYRDGHIERVPEGSRITVTAASLLSTARYVLGLGGLARAESPALRVLVRELALSVLDQHEALGV